MTDSNIAQQDYHGPGQHLVLVGSLPNPLRQFFMCTGLLQHYQAQTPPEDGGLSSEVVPTPEPCPPVIPERIRWKDLKEIIKDKKKKDKGKKK
jgi:hypothetical protein